MRIKAKLILSYVIVIFFSISVLGLLIGKKSKDAIFYEVTEKSQLTTGLIKDMVSVRHNLLSEKVVTDLNLARKVLTNLGDIKINKNQQNKIEKYSLPSIYAGKTNLTIDSSITKDIYELTGAMSSIFLYHNNELIRVSTTINSDAKKVIGISINKNSPIYKKITDKKAFHGRSVVNNDWYITAYEPIVDDNNNLIGAFALGYKELNPHLENTISNIKIGKTGYAYVMDSKGNLIIHPYLKGNNLLNTNFAKEIIKNKSGTIEYEMDGVYKLAAYEYFEPLDWYIVTTANYDDLKSSSKTILKTTVSTGVLIFYVALIMALALADNFVKPIRKLEHCMKIATKGNLSVYSDIKSNDEIGVLSQSFNKMIKENKRLLEETIKYDKLKTEFFANISHELKTPLNIIFATAQLLSLNNSSYEKMNINMINKYVDTIKQNCYRLIRLINNLIDITKIDSGYIEFNPENKNIVEIVENITLSTAQYVESKNRTLIFDTDTEEKIMACDFEKLERIMLNLISNAIKFTSEGDKIEVTLSDKDSFIQISVKDNGIGIPYDKQKMIFERFKQVDPLLCRKHEGSGIGLSLVKALVEIHKGNIHLKSRYKKGSEFIIELPSYIIEYDNNNKKADDFIPQDNVEKIQIEFSDIYN